MPDRTHKILLIAIILPILTGFLWYTNQTWKRVPIKTELLQARLNFAEQNFGGQAQQAAALRTHQVSLLPLSGETDNSLGALGEPVENFTARITKKSFGIYITPETSPVQPDRFTGYHTGVDAEYDDVFEDVPVRAIAAGKVIVSQFVHGYGGVMVIRHIINGESVQALYGHLDPASMISVGSEVVLGQTIGILGDGETEETDGARKHLHFALLQKEELDVRGYVLDETELAGWYNPMDFYAR